MDDPGEALAIRARAGDRAAFTALVEHYRDRAFRVAYRVVGNREEAMDVVQEAFIRLYHRLPSWDGRARFFTWFYSLLTHLAIDQMRKRPRTLPLAPQADEFLPDPSEQGQAEYEDLEEHDALLARARRAVAALPEAQRAVVELRHYDGLSLAEIAEVRGIALGTVKSTLFAAFRSLRSALGVDTAAAPTRTGKGDAG